MSTYRASIALLVPLLLVACSSEPAGPADSADSGGSDTGSGDTAGGGDTAGDAPTPAPGPDVDVPVFLFEDVYFTGEENRREIYAAVTLPPPEQTFERITLEFALACPDGRCDPWDRLGSFGIVRNRGGEAPQFVELSRFVTPYRVGAEWNVDVTDLRPLLQGDVEFYVFIDTWVGPGSQFGNGWEVTAQLAFDGGVPPRDVVGVYPVTNGRTRYVYGNPDLPIPEQFAPVDVVLPDEATSWSLMAYVTGHGQGNADNCAEFCPRTHSFVVDGTPHNTRVWRDDCETTAPSNQQGTWQYPRAGWCPGTEAAPIVLRDFPVPAAGSVRIGYDVEAYENTCRPEAQPCAGCTLGNSCEWNDSNHTEPNYQVSAVVVAYR